MGSCAERDQYPHIGAPGSRAQVFLEYTATDAFTCSSTPSPFGDRGDTPRWGPMAGSAAWCLRFFRCCPLFPCTWSCQECDILMGDHPKNRRVPPKELDRRQHVSTSTSGVARRRSVRRLPWWLVGANLISTLSYAFIPSVSVLFRPACTYCSRVFVVALSLTSTHRWALYQEYLSSSSVQTTWAAHYVSRKMAEVNNPAVRDRTVPHREQ